METLRLWEVATGECARTYTFTGHQSAVFSVCLSADGRYALSGTTAMGSSQDNPLRLWFLDWELEDREPADWDEGARQYLDTFVRLYTPQQAGLFWRHPAPAWNGEDFDRLLHTLGYAGYGWLRPEKGEPQAGRTRRSPTQGQSPVSVTGTRGMRR